jgi:aspartate-semialdehyde dehydrogenase
LFPEGLAFDVLPSIGAIEENGQSATEILLSQELANILDMQEIFFRCSLQVLPIFAGITITAQLAFGAEVSVQQITSLLSEDASMVVGDQVPTLRNVITSPKIYVGRIRSNPLLQGCDLTIHCDNVSVAVQNALDMLESFQKEDII